MFQTTSHFKKQRAKYGRDFYDYLCKLDRKQAIQSAKSSIACDDPFHPMWRGHALASRRFLKNIGETCNEQA